MRWSPPSACSLGSFEGTTFIISHRWMEWETQRGISQRELGVSRPVPGSPGQAPAAWLVSLTDLIRFEPTLRGLASPGPSSPRKPGPALGLCFISGMLRGPGLGSAPCRSDPLGFTPTPRLRISRVWDGPSCSDSKRNPHSFRLPDSLPPFTGHCSMVQPPGPHRPGLAPASVAVWPEPESRPL